MKAIDLIPVDIVDDLRDVSDAIVSLTDLLAEIPDRNGSIDAVRRYLAPIEKTLKSVAVRLEAVHTGD